MIITNTTNARKNLFYKVNGQIKKVIFLGGQTQNLPDLVNHSQIIRNNFDLKVKHINETLDRELIPTLSEKSNNEKFFELFLLFSDLTATPVADPESVSDWNDFFELPLNGEPFTNVIADYDTGEVRLYGGKDITLKTEIFVNFHEILSFLDDGCIIALGDSTFLDAQNLTTVSIPKITSIPSQTFYYCIYLDTVNFPLVTSVGTNSFGYTRLLQLNETNFPLLHSIADFAFDSSKLQSINLPLVTSVLESAFQLNDDLQSVNFASLTLLNDRVFENCNSLNEANFEKVTNIGVNTFAYCPLTSVTFPLVESVGDYSFSTTYLSELSENNFPSLVTIGVSAFENSQIQNINLPLVDTIGQNAFQQNALLESVTLPSVIVLGDYVFDNCSSLADTSFGMLENIGSRTFRICTALSTFDFSTVTSIGSNAFEGCGNLSGIILPLITNGSMGTYVFYACTNITSIATINIPQLTIIPEGTFQSCSIETINLPNVTLIEKLAFSYCANLISVTLTNVTQTGSEALAACPLLPSISLPNLINCGEKTFSECSSLITIYLPLCTNLGGTTGNDEVFYGGPSAKTVSLTIPASRMTCDAGNPDGDIVYLQSRNTVNVTQV